MKVKGGWGSSTQLKTSEICSISALMKWSGLSACVRFSNIDKWHEARLHVKAQYTRKTSSEFQPKKFSQRIFWTLDAMSANFETNMLNKKILQALQITPASFPTLWQHYFRKSTPGPRATFTLKVSETFLDLSTSEIKFISETEVSSWERRLLTNCFTRAKILQENFILWGDDHQGP